MASTLAPIPPLPAPQVAFTLANGVINPAWYEYLKKLDAHTREIEARITAGGL